MDDALLERMAKELTQLKIRVGILQSAISFLREIDTEEFDRRVEELLLSEDGRRAYEATLMMLKGQPPPE
jgi:hypothetical protein